MFRFSGGGLVALVILAFWLWGIFDVIATEAGRVRNLPKLAWLLLVVLLGALGSLAWLLLGRPAGATLSPGAKTMRRGAEPAWMEEDARRRRYAELDEELDRRLEARRLQERDDDRRRELGDPGSDEPNS